MKMQTEIKILTSHENHKIILYKYFVCFGGVHHKQKKNREIYHEK